MMRPQLLLYSAASLPRLFAGQGGGAKQDSNARRVGGQRLARSPPDKTILCHRIVVLFGGLAPLDSSGAQGGMAELPPEISVPQTWTQRVQSALGGVR